MEVLVSKTIKAAQDYNVKEILVAGGVSANQGLREKLTNESPIKVLFPPMKYCTDNAAMIASAGRVMFEHNLFSSLDLSVKPSYDLEEESVGD